MAETPDAQPQAVWEKLGISLEAFYRLPPGDRIRLERLHHPQPPVSRRPTSRRLTAEELAALQAEGLTGAAYIERARAMQQSPPPPEP